MTVHDIFAQCGVLYYNYIHKLITNYCVKSAFRRCDALLVHSEGLREALSDLLGESTRPST